MSEGATDLQDGDNDLQDGDNDVEDDLSFLKGIFPGLIMWAVLTVLPVVVVGEWAGLTLEGGSPVFEWFVFVYLTLLAIPLGYCLHRRVTVEDALCIKSFSDLRSVSVTKHLRIIFSKRGPAYLLRGYLYGFLGMLCHFLSFTVLGLLVPACLSIYVLFLCYLAFYGKSLKKLLSNDINRSLTQLWRLRSSQWVRHISTALSRIHDQDVLKAWSLAKATAIAPILLCVIAGFLVGTGELVSSAADAVGDKAESWLNKDLERRKREDERMQRNVEKGVRRAFGIDDD